MEKFGFIVVSTLLFAVLALIWIPHFQKPTAKVTKAGEQLGVPEVSAQEQQAAPAHAPYSSSDLKSVLERLDTSMIKPGAVLGIGLKNSPQLMHWTATKVDDHWAIEDGLPEKSVASAILEIDYSAADEFINSQDAGAELQKLRQQGLLYASYVNELAAFSNGILQFAQKYRLI